MATLRREIYREIANGINIRMGIATLLDETFIAEGVAQATRTVAGALKRENANFRYDVFYSACGLDDWGYMPGDPKSPAQQKETQS